MILDDVHEDYVCQKALLKNLALRARAGDDAFLQHVTIPGINRRPAGTKAEKAAIAETIKRLNERIDDLYLVGLVSAFENFVFARLREAAPRAASTLDSHYATTNPVGAYRTGLAKTLDDFSKLGDLHPLFERGALGPSEREGLRNLIQHRNFIAHGRRQDWARAKDFVDPIDIESAYRLLKAIALTL